MNRLRVTRVQIEAPVASFRYPFFQIGRQVSYDMPPPSTIYGILCCVKGELAEPSNVRFGYRCTVQGRARDLEHQHVIYAGGSKFEYEGNEYPMAVQGAVQPHERDFLFGVSLTLYVQGEEWTECFRQPQFCVTLGRSQDLASIVSVDSYWLESAPAAYFEKTILPFSWRTRVGRGVTVQMPRYIEPPPGRFPYFDRYIALNERVFDVATDEVSQGLRVIRGFAEQAEAYWVDPASEASYGAKLGIVFHSIVD